MANIATFGEIMLRLSPPGKELLFQSPELRAVFGGGEANVAVSLAVWGHRSRWISVVPANPVGDAALRELRRYGVDVGAVVRGGRRLGIYFAETGANERPSQVLYDREGSAIAEAGPGAIDWDAALDGMDWLHVTGITPALSASAAALTLEAVKAARAREDDRLGRPQLPVQAVAVRPPGARGHARDRRPGGPRRRERGGLPEGAGPRGARPISPRAGSTSGPTRS